MKTPLKIRLNRFGSISGLEDADGRSVCQFQPKGIDPRKTAAFIVRACNSHEKHRELAVMSNAYIESIADQLEHIHKAPHEAKALRQLLEIARAALKSGTQ